MQNNANTIESVGVKGVNMKKRNGFVSNSSSSSFLIGSNNYSNTENAIIQNFEKIFAAGPDDNNVNALVSTFKTELAYEFDYGNIETTTWRSLDELREYIKREWYNDFNADIDEDIGVHKALFEKWKYVHEVSFADSGDGGSKLTTILRNCFPHNFISDEIEIRIWD